MRPTKKKRSLIERARRKWQEAVGGEMAAKSHPQSLRRGVLTVAVESSSLLAELAGYRKAGIVKILNSAPTALGIREIKFVLSEGDI